MPHRTQARAVGAKHRVFVVDDHPIVRQGLALLIDQEPDLEVCGEAEEAETALAAISAARPDVLLLDISLPGPDGIDLLKTIRATDTHSPGARALDARRVRLRRARASGGRERLHHETGGHRERPGGASPHPPARGLRERSDRELRCCGSWRRVAASPTQAPIARLSDRELEVFRLIGEGHGTRQIADELHLSVKTVESYQAHIKEKLVAAELARSGAAGHRVEARRAREVTRSAGIPRYLIQGISLSRLGGPACLRHLPPIPD